MSEDERRQLAKMIAEEMRNDDHSTCPLGLTDEAAKSLMDFAGWWSGIQRAGKFMLIGIFLIGAISIFVSGVVEKFGQLFEKIMGMK